MSEDIKDLIEAQNRAFAEFKQANDARLAQIEAKGGADPVTLEKLAKLDQSLAELGSKLAEAEKKLARPPRGAGDDAHEQKAAQRLDAMNLAISQFASRQNRQTKLFSEIGQVDRYNQAFVAWARTGREDALQEFIRQDMSVGSDPDGGYLVPADLTGRIVARIYDLSPIRQIAFVQPTSASELEGIVDNSDFDAGWVAETGTRNTTTTATIGRYSIAAEEMYAQPKITTKLLADAAVNLEAWLTMKLSDRFARLEGAASVGGDGINKPRGFTSYTTAATADGSRAWGTLEHKASGVSGGFATPTTSVSPADVLVDLVYALKAGYRANARWVTSKATLAAVRKFKDVDGNYIWQPGIAPGQPSTLLGYPVTEAEDMPALAANSLSVAFGDFREGYLIADRMDMTMLRDPYTDKGFVKFYTTKRVGGAVVNSEAIKFIKNT
jgi:HK97 family phage major capsid protein